MTTSIKNVSSKLLKAIAKVGGKVQKTGYNSFSRYNYITESDVNTAVLPALLEQGLLLTTSVDGFTETPATPDNKNRFASITLNHTIIDTESGEMLLFKSAAVAADTLDKAIFKSYAGACKYFMLKLFLISGTDDDPENDSHTKPVETKKETKPVSKPEPKKEEPKLVNKFKPNPTKSTGFVTKPKVEVEDVPDSDLDPAF
jgi:hypothetical protein